MAIEIYPSYIKFNNYQIKITSSGIGVYNAAGYTVPFTAAGVSNFGARGSVAGYLSGGESPAFSPQTTSAVDRFPFGSDVPATSTGGLSATRQLASGQSSNAHGYTSGGRSVAPPGTVSNRQTIDRFPFSVNVTASNVGNLTASRFGLSGQSSSVSGYASGGNVPSPLTISNIIDKFPFSTDSVTAASVGNMSYTYFYSAGQSSLTHGYITGGYTPTFPGIGNPVVTQMHKFPFSTDSGSSLTAYLSNTARQYSTGQSSDVSGYVSGGQQIPPFVSLNIIDKFPFATDTNATDVGDLSQSRLGPSGQSSMTHGYTSGGQGSEPPFPGVTNAIDKFPFSTDGTVASSVGNISSARRYSSGNQY